MNNENLIDPATPSLPNFRKKILVVEDEPHWQKIISRSIRSVDDTISVRCVRSAKQAEQLLYADGTFDLVIADHHLEGEQTGLDLWKTMRSERRSIPFIMVSGLAEEDFKSFIEGAGEHRAPFYMAKPFDVGQLRSVLTWQLGTPSTSLKKNLRKSMIAASLVLALTSGWQMFGLATTPPPQATLPTYHESVGTSSGPAPRLHQMITPGLRKQIARIVRHRDTI